MASYSFLASIVACTMIAPQIFAAAPVVENQENIHWQYEPQNLNEQCDYVNRPMDCNPS